ncbi:MAG: Gfo/Idh/MocA family oxidoreductase [Planctomycetes bacterium]|nr:Gfo/Idh/MocA family oxidoreductase [Planctomycetota bacterium]
MNRQMSRRTFLRSAAAAGGAGLIVLAGGPPARGYAANAKLSVALVGVGGRGTWFVDTIPKMENVVAFCDVSSRKLQDAFARLADQAKKFAESPNDWERQAAADYNRLLEGKIKTYPDFRVMLAEMEKQIDAVVVATPDHTHAVASAAAIRAGKHVFCEKPLTRAIGESRALRELARKHKVATSMGNQGTAAGPFRRALELIRDGTIGPIKEVHVWNTGGGGDKQQPPQGNPPVPDYLNWDLWLGPAAVRPYHQDWLRRNSWRDFGTCQLGNWASHTANLAFMALKVHELWGADAPKSPRPLIRCEAKTSGINRLSFPRWEVVRWEIPARAEFPPITFTWHNGPAPGSHDMLFDLMKVPAADRKPIDFGAALLVGTKGTIHTTGHNATFRIIPEDAFKDVEKDKPQTVDASRGHERDWLLACRGGKPAWANFEYAAPLNEFLMLGNVATQFEGKLEFDPAECKIAGNAEADKLLRPDYREGWSL